MKPIRIGDLALRGLLDIYIESEKGQGDFIMKPPESALAMFIQAEITKRGFDSILDAWRGVRRNQEVSNDATPFDQLVKERAIAIKGLRRIEKAAHKIHASDQHVPAQEVEDIAEEFCNMAHNALDEIGDDRESEL